jgi:hypothetical protein
MCGRSSIVQRYINPALICLPLWLRLLQCLRRYHDSATRVPHIPNSIKYGQAMGSSADSWGVV